MIDATLRPLKDRLVQPLARRIAGRLSAEWITLSSLAFSIGAAALIATGARWAALSSWLIGRLLDGLDGPVAREAGAQTDLGGYLDIMGDTLGYAAVPIGVAMQRASGHVWAACAVLLASFYVNTMSWTYLSAIAEKRSAGTASFGEPTSVHMPTGLIEGGETIILFTLMLALPALASVWFIAMTALVAITAAQRVVWARGNLR
jgi:phosphatidylglycerophosphate synthase